MCSEWSGFFEYICSMHSGEIAKLLENTEYKSLSDKIKKNKNNKIIYDELVEKKAACYYEQAAIVVLKHFFNLIRETGVL